MKRSLHATSTTVLLAAALIFCTPFPGSVARADSHVLALSELRDAVSQKNAQRAADRAVIDHFFSEPRVRTALKRAGVASEKIQQQASLLSDQEQAQLAARVRSADRQISAGELKDTQVTLIIMIVALFCFMTVLILAFK